MWDGREPLRQSDLRGWPGVLDLGLGLDFLGIESWLKLVSQERMSCLVPYSPAFLLGFGDVLVKRLSGTTVPTMNCAMAPGVVVCAIHIATLGPSRGEGRTRSGVQLIARPSRAWVLCDALVERVVSGPQLRADEC